MKLNQRRQAFEYELFSYTDDMFGSIFEKTPVAIIILSLSDKQVFQANLAALTLLKVKTIEGLPKRYPNIFNKFNPELFGSRDFIELELRLRNTKGGVIYLAAKARKFEKTKIILTLEDITCYKNETKKLIKLARFDGLTGLLNHKTVMLRFKEELDRAKKYHLPLSCFMFDMDDFKAFNDNYGHLQGDQLLKKTAQMLKGRMRESDIVGRYGGDEFLVIMPETPIDDAWIPAKRIHSFFLQNPFLVRNKNIEVKNTFSIGISGFPQKGIKTVKGLIDQADKGLYESKLKGGNQIIFSAV